MEQELPTPKQEIQDLTNESTNALKDGNIDETEKVKLDRLSQKIRDFVAQKEDDKPVELQRRQDALERAIEEVSAKEGIAAIEIYKMIWGETVQQVMDELPFSFFPEFEKWEKKTSPLVLKHRCVDIAKNYPFFVFEGFEHYKDEPFSKDVLCAVADSKEPELLLSQFKTYANAPYAEALLEKGVRATAEKKPTFILLYHEEFKGKKYESDVLKIAAKKEPAEVLSYCASGKFKETSFGEELILEAMKNAAISSNSASACLTHINLYKERPQMHDTLKKTLLSADVRTVFELYPKFREMPLAMEVVVSAAKSNTAEAVLAFRKNTFEADVETAKAVLRVCVNLLPNHVAQYLGKDFSDHPDYKQMIQEGMQVLKDADSIEEQMSFTDRQEKLNHILLALNSELVSDTNSALSAFNNETGLGMRCMGIRSDDGGTVRNTFFEYVLINTFTGKNKMPVRIAFSYEEAKVIRGKDDVLRLLRKKYEAEQATHKEQYEMWSRKYSYDLPKNGKTAVMFAMVPGSLRNVESDMVRMAEIYKSNYGASFSAVCVQKMDNWQKALQDKNPEAIGIPQAVGATEKEILDTLVISLKKAIDDGKEAFVFHYMMHGGEKGTMSASNGSFPAEKIAQAITTEHNGKPISEQIEITIFKESCFSGSQIEKEAAYLKEQKSRVKNLHIIAAVSKYAPSEEGLELKDASVISEKMRGNQAAVLHYHISYYFELIDHLKSSGIKIEEPLGTYSHAIQFADLMTREDSRYQRPRNGQNPEGFHYSTEKNIEEFFSGIDVKKQFGSQIERGIA